MDNEEKLADAEEPRTSHKPHHHPPKNHVNRHHKKYDKTVHTITDHTTSRTTDPITKIGISVSNEKISTAEERLDKYSTNPIETSTAETTYVTGTPGVTILTTIKSKKPAHRQKIKEIFTNRTDIEEDKPQRRRKMHHHHRRNNTLLTNSIHDDVVTGVAHVNVNGTNDATLSTQDPTTPERYDYNQHRFTTNSSATMTEATIMRQGITDVFRSSNDFATDHTTESIVVTELKTTTTMTLAQATERPRTSPATSRSANPDRSRSNIHISTIPITMPTTTLSVRKYPKVQKNRTSGILGPARIDVTILEAPDRKHKQSTLQIKYIIL